MAESKSSRHCASCHQPRVIRCRGLCASCYQRVRKQGLLHNFAKRNRSFDENLALARERETVSGCWPWPTTSWSGYGTIVRLDGRGVGPHVVSWVRRHGPVPVGKTIDHLCHTNDPSCHETVTCPHRRCVNPDHLEPATMSEQIRRGRKYTSPTCKSGHERTSSNIKVKVDRDGHTHRACIRCEEEGALKRIGVPRVKAIAALVNSGFTQREAAERHGVSRRAACSALKALPWSPLVK